MSGRHRHVVPNAIVKLTLGLLNEVLLDLADFRHYIGLGECLSVVHESALCIGRRIEEGIDNFYHDRELGRNSEYLIIVNAGDLFNAEVLPDHIHTLAAVEFIVKRGTFFKISLAILALDGHVETRALVVPKHV